ncbi:hypothetical protein AAVH_30540 [Aphelenchoides avenae]|nr:hypothetical protein AAVH_30540 [Aphelenchus avenae]
MSKQRGATVLPPVEPPGAGEPAGGGGGAAVEASAGTDVQPKQVSLRVGEAEQQTKLRRAQRGRRSLAAAEGPSGAGELCGGGGGATVEASAGTDGTPPQPKDLPEQASLLVAEEERQTRLRLAQMEHQYL